MMILILFSTLFAFAEEPIYWNHILEVTDKHEFYQNHETITKPQESWQTLFSLVYIDKNLSRVKDCVYYKVPAKESGILKLKAVAASESCDQFILSPGDKEISGIKSLQFAVFEKEVSIDFRRENYNSQKWRAKLQSSHLKKDAKLNMSSAEFKSPGIIYLGPETNIKISEKNFLKDKTLCHDVNEDCEEVTPSKCSQCENGWYEIPNGCTTGPKYCGAYSCGLKGEPACRRGLKWKKKDEKFDCRIDSSFAYCSNGAQIVCEGQKAFCR